MAIAKGARQRGARMEQNCEVTRLQPRTDGRWDVVTEKVMHNPIWTGHGDLLPTELFSDLTLKMFKKSILNYGVLAHTDTLIYTVLAAQVSDFVLLIITN